MSAEVNRAAWARAVSADARLSYGARFAGPIVAETDGRAYVVATVKEVSGVSLPTANRAVRSLIANGWLRVDAPRNGPEGRTFTLTVPEGVDLAAYDIKGLRDRIDRDGCRWTWLPFRQVWVDGLTGDSYGTLDALAIGRGPLHVAP